MAAVPRAVLDALRSRVFVAFALAVPVGAVACGVLPLFEVPGLELGLGLALASTLVMAPALGIAAVRRPLTPVSPERRGSGGVLAPFAATTAALLAVLLLAWGASALRAAVWTPCRPFAGAAQLALAAFPSALLAAAVAVAAAVAARGRTGRAVALYGVVVLASLASTLAIGYRGPAAFALDHLLGIWPGPIYDEVLEVDRRVLLFRAGTLAWAGVALAAAALLARRRAGGALSGPALAGALALCAVIAAARAGGAAPTRAQLAAALGQVREGPRCTVHLAKERGAADAERALRDCEYDAFAVANALGLAAPPRVTVWVYRSAEEKRRLVGAGHTSYTKPWLAEVHVHDQGVPHPLLRHELVHALASAAAPPPLRLPARAVILIDGGLLEGLAVALEVPSTDFGVHGWARAMRDQGRLPPTASLLGPGRFFGAAPARAYTAAGSFLRFLLDRHGGAAVLAAYGAGDVSRGLGRPLAELDGEWQRFLDGVEVAPRLAAAAESRFSRGSLFERACAREIAVLERDAASPRLAPQERERAARRASQLAGGDPAYLRAAVEAWRRSDAGRATAVAGEALARAEAVGARGTLRAALHTALGDLRLGAGDPAAAAAHFHAALALHPGSAESRTLRAKLALAENPALRDALAPSLLGLGDAGARSSALAASDAPLARYLLARVRLARGAPGLALATLSGVDAAALPDESFRREAARMRAEALCKLGRWEEGIAAWRAAAAQSVDDGARQQAQDAAARCSFERDVYGRPVPWEGDS